MASSSVATGRNERAIKSAERRREDDRPNAGEPYVRLQFWCSPGAPRERAPTASSVWCTQGRRRRATHAVAAAPHVMADRRRAMSPRRPRLSDFLGPSTAQSGRFLSTLAADVVGGAGFHTTMSQKYSLWGCGTLTQVAGNSQRSHG